MPTHTSTGHILTKFELQVLSGLLNAYSNEKIKEIQQSIRKKQGGDISLEEVESSLRDGGLTTVADELEQSLLKGKFTLKPLIKLLHKNFFIVTHGFKCLLLAP